MELDALDLVAAMAQAHDDAVVGFGGDGQLAGKRFPLDDERMIARGREGLGEFAEDILSIMMNFTGFSVEEFRSANDFSAERRANGLMAEANA